LKKKDIRKKIEKYLKQADQDLLDSDTKDLGSKAFAAGRIAAYRNVLRLWK
jgi:hypothetical protein